MQNSPKNISVNFTKACMGKWSIPPSGLSRSASQSGTILILKVYPPPPPLLFKPVYTGPLIYLGVVILLPPMHVT